MSTPLTLQEIWEHADIEEIEVSHRFETGVPETVHRLEIRVTYRLPMLDSETHEPTGSSYTMHKAFAVGIPESALLSLSPVAVCPIRILR